MMILRHSLVWALIMMLALAPTLPAQAMPASLPEAEDVVSVLSLPGLLEVGEHDPTIDWVTEFESTSGCRVDAIIAPNPDQLAQRLANGGIDVVITGGDQVDRFRRAGLLAEINTTLLSGFGDLDPRLNRAPTGGVNGKFYGVSLHWAPWVLVYNGTNFKLPPDGLRALFEPVMLADGASDRGRISVWGRPLDLAQAALYVRARHPELAIRDPFALSDAQFQAVIEAARSQRKLVPRKWVSSDEQAIQFLSGRAVLGLTWPLQAELLAAKNRPFVSLHPKEGVIAWVDGAMLASGAKHPGCAYRFMDHMISAKVNGTLAAWYGSIPAVADACTSNPRLSPALCLARGQDLIDSVEFTRLPDEACARAGRTDCVGMDRWITDWTALQRD
jgi:putative spermidine/putrescine transport system substrate-binding protein